MKFARPISVYAALHVLMCYLFDTIWNITIEDDQAKIADD